ESAWEQFETPRRPRLDDVQHAKDQESDDRTPDVYRMERQRHEHADDLVDHDGPGVDASEMMFGFGRTPQADHDNDDNRAEFDRGRLLASNHIVENQSDEGTECSWRNGRIANVRARGDEYTQTAEGHGPETTPIRRTGGESLGCRRTDRAGRDGRRTAPE